MITIFISNKRLRNSQSYYKLSLAVADLMVGSVVIPLMIYLYIKTITRSSEKSETDNRFKNFFGFISSLSLLCSGCTLIAAIYDRFMAISQPLSYNRHRALYRARIILVVLWASTSMLCSFPLYFYDIRYKVSAVFFISMSGKTGKIILFILFAITIIMLWSIAIMTFYASRKQKSTITQERNTEIRLAMTLLLMTIVFTVCLLPISVLLIIWVLNECLYSPHNALLYKSLLDAKVIAILMLLSNSLWNCFIYSGRNKLFRQSVANLYSNLYRKISYYCYRSQNH